MQWIPVKFGITVDDRKNDTKTPIHQLQIMISLTTLERILIKICLRQNKSTFSYHIARSVNHAFRIGLTSEIDQRMLSIANVSLKFIIRLIMMTFNVLYLILHVSPTTCSGLI